MLINDSSMAGRAQVRTLEESEERYRLLVEGVKDYAIFMLDTEGRVLTWNEGARRAKGYTAEEIIGQSMERFYTPEDRAQGKPAFMLKTATEQDRVEDEGWRMRKDGSRFWADVVLTAVRDREKRLIGFSKITRDLSERKRAETELNRYVKERAENVTEHGRLTQSGTDQKQALGESEERYRLLVKGVKDYAIFMLDLEGRVLTWNEGAERAKGYSAEEIIGQSMERFYTPEDRAQDKPAGMLKTAEKEGRAVFEGWRIRKSGAQFWADVVITAVRDRSNQLIGYSEVSRDLSERKRAETDRVRYVKERAENVTELKETETKYRGLMEAAPDAMVVVNQKGEIVLLNVRAEKQFGYSRDELLGQKVKNIIPEGFAERLIADGTRSAADALAQQIGMGIELSGRRRDGSEFPIEIMLSPLDSPEGILVTAAIREITERKKSEAHLVKTVGELKRSNDELQQFANVASHDLQEPLRMITSYTQLLSKRYKGKLDADADEFIAYAADGASRMRTLIEDLLTYSRLGTNKVPFVQVDSNTILQRALLNLSVTVQESHAAVTSDPLPLVFAVESQFLQLLQNLVGNAIKYHGDNPPQVHVSATKKESEWVFSVRDNGIGLDPQYADRIFVIFQRLHTIEKYPGTGIGLAVCRKIVERHGGRIWVDSHPGQGATFYFTIPIQGDTKIGNSKRS